MSRRMENSAKRIEDSVQESGGWWQKNVLENNQLKVRHEEFVTHTVDMSRCT